MIKINILLKENTYYRKIFIQIRALYFQINRTYINYRDNFDSSYH